MLHIGCCGYTVAKTRYHESLGVVELPQTFFQPPGLGVLSKWRAGAPAGFEFIVRAWQLVTHDPDSPTYAKLRQPVPDYRRPNYGWFRPTAEVRRAWEATAKAASMLGARLIVFQSPAQFKPTPENVENVRRFFEGVNGRGFTLVWEPKGWAHDAVAQLCAQLGLVQALDPARCRSVPEDARFIRLCGRLGFKYRYTDLELSLIAERYGRQQDAYVIFSNSWMFDDAVRLRALAAA